MSKQNTGPSGPSVRKLIEEAAVKIAERLGTEVVDTELIAKQAIESVAESIFDSMIAQAREHQDQSQRDLAEFQARHEAKWKRGFWWLHLHRYACIDAGREFQREFLAHERYLHDPLFGVLIRLHAHACRIQAEVISLLAAGYPDGAFARWRTLHEIAVTAIVLREAGERAAVDYIKFGIVQAVNGMHSFQETADRMGRRPYTVEEIRRANATRDEMTADSDVDFKSRNGWARKYVGTSRFEKLQRAAGLDHWRTDYSFASRDIHADFRQMSALLAMSKAAPEVLLVGPSDTGIVEPAHSGAIALMQTTVAFITARNEDEDCPIDFSTSVVMSKVLQRMTDEVGQVFLKLSEDQGASDS